MKNLLFEKKNLLFVLTSVLSLTLMVACGDKDEDDLGGGVDTSTWVRGVKMDGGNVIWTYGSDGMEQRNVFVYKSGAFDHFETQVQYPDKSMAKALYDATKKDVKKMDEISSIKLNGKVVTVVYNTKYTTGYEEMTAQELYEVLKAAEDYY